MMSTAAATSSSPPTVELYTTRTPGSSSASSVLDLYCGRSPSCGDVTSVSYHGDASPARYSPATSPTSDASPTAAGGLDAAALRLMLAERQQLFQHHQPPTATLPIFGGGPPLHQRIQQPQHQLEASAFYLPPNLQLAADVSATAETFNGLYNSPLALGSFDPRMTADYQTYLHCYGGLHDVRRKNATRESTSTLKSWLIQHIKNPYPTKGEKIMLAIITKMTLTQVSTWFANARRRLKKENKMQWSPRQRNGDDDDDDVDDDETPNDVMNGSFSISEDECSTDVIVDDTSTGEFNGAHSRLFSDAVPASVDESHRNTTSSDRHVTSSGPRDGSANVTEIASTDRRLQHHVTQNGDRLPSTERRPGSVANDNDVNQIPSPAKPRIWSIAELATSNDDDDERRKHNRIPPPTTSAVAERYRQVASSSSADFRSSWPAFDEVTQMLYRKQFADRLMAGGARYDSGEQLPFPVAAVEALRWQMAAAAAAACRSMGATACSGRSSSPLRDALVHGTVPTDGQSADTCHVPKHR